MDGLAEFQRKIDLYESMLIETGGSFGRGALGGDRYEQTCLDLARGVLSSGGDKQALLAILEQTMQTYATEHTWRYYDLEMAFLTGLHTKVSQL